MRRIAVCALLGVTTTVAIAWALAFTRPLSRADSGLFSIDRQGDAWMGLGSIGPGWREMTLYGATGIGEEGRAVARRLPPWVNTRCDGPLEHRAVTTIGAGWPMIAFQARRTGVGHDEPPPGSNAWRTGLGPQWVEWRAWEGGIGAASGPATTARDSRPLPTALHPLGFLVNVTFWSAIWSLPLVVLALRRSVRRRRGRCANCGYDLRGDLARRPCPECGVT